MPRNSVDITRLRLFRPFIPHPTHHQKRRLTDGLEDSQQRPHSHETFKIVTGGVEAEDTAPADDSSAEEFPDGEDLDELGRSGWLAMVCRYSHRFLGMENLDGQERGGVGDSLG